ncbi:MAG: ATP-binding protein, partial [Anaerolineae bacterium]|nr:ATP-binding protein [Anaerolineae bacterium]
APNTQELKKWVPPAMRSAEDTGLNMGILTDLAIKTIYYAGYINAQEVANRMKLPFTGVVDRVLEILKREKWIEVRGQSGISEASFEYMISEKGSSKAREVLERSLYAGACPVTLPQYIYAMKAQARQKTYVTRETIQKLLEGLTFDQEVMDRIGPAVNSGKAVFMHGPPGNGKTTLASRVGRAVLGEDIWIPYAVDVDGQVIRLFDNVNHEVLEHASESNERAGQTGVRRDPRWVRIRRPMIMVGGELTMDGLDLIYDPINKFYEAPFQMKANGGLFFIDDFGRQSMRPQDLLNRWIVPLESRIDFLTLNTGRKIELPFNVMIFFSTNLDPKQLVDEAFLRLIPYKIHIGDPTFDQFREIFVSVAKAKKVPYDENGLKYLIQEWYLKKERPLRCVHPRDILDQLLDMARYLNKPPQMNKELLDHAASAYFVDLGQYTAVTRT